MLGVSNVVIQFQKWSHPLPIQSRLPTPNMPPQPTKGAFGHGQLGQGCRIVDRGGGTPMMSVKQRMA